MANRFVLNETSYHGAGAIKDIATEAKGRGFKKAFVCSDPDLIKFGVTKKVIDVLEGAGLDYEIYSNIKPNPNHSRMCRTGVAAFQEVLVRITIDRNRRWFFYGYCKGVSVLSLPTRNLKMSEAWRALRRQRIKSVPIFAVPTTAGTAAEVTINYVITDVEKNT